MHVNSSNPCIHVNANGWKFLFAQFSRCDDGDCDGDDDDGYGCDDRDDDNNDDDTVDNNNSNMNIEHKLLFLSYGAFSEKSI